MNDIISVINDKIYCSIINDIDFNVSNKEIKFALTLHEDNEKTHHIMQFMDVTSFIWIEKQKDSESYDYREWDYYEMTSIDIMKIGMTSEDEWLKQYPLDYNIAIEIWETALLIKATKVIIDDQHFSIK